MKKKSGVVRGSAMLTLVRIVSSLCAFILFWCVSQKSINQLGAFRTIFVFFLFSEFLPLLGMNQYMIREVSVHQQAVKKYILHAALFALAVSMIIILGFGMLSRFGSYSTAVSQGFLVVAAGMPATAVVLCGQSILVGLGKGFAFGVLQGIETVARTIIGLAVMYAGGGVVGVVVGFVVVRWLIVPCYWRAIRPGVGPQERWQFDPVFLKTFVSHVPMFGAILLLYMVIRYAAQVMLPWVKGDSAAGFFAVPCQFLDIAMLVPTAVVINLMPLFAQKARVSREELGRACSQALKILAALIVPLVVGVFLFAEPIVIMVFKDIYLPSVPVLKILIWVCLLMTIDQVLSTALIASGNQKTDLLSLVVGAAAIIIFLCLRIPGGAALGAAQGVLAGVTVLVATRWMLGRSIIGGLNPLVALWRIALAACGMGAAVVLTGGLHWIIRGILGLAAYAALLVGLVAASRTERLDMLAMLQADARKE